MLEVALETFDGEGIAVVFGAGGGIGSALVRLLRASNQFEEVVGISRNLLPDFDISCETSIQVVVSELLEADRVRLALDATGFLHDDMRQPEKSLRSLDLESLQHSFAINAIGPALLMKHVFPYLSRRKKSLFGTLSARVGSISDNKLGGWYGYRASKAALNQFVRTASIELSRVAPEAICVALHPGTVATPLSFPFTRNRGNVFSPEVAASRLLSVVDALTPSSTGQFFDWAGKRVPW